MYMKQTCLCHIILGRLLIGVCIKLCFIWKIEHIINFDEMRRIGQMFCLLLYHPWQIADMTNSHQ